jgi:DNA-repair protein XRCC4
MEVTISRFKLAGTLFYFNCRWFDTYFEVDLSDGKYVWQGNATREYIEEELKPKGMDFSEYITLVKEAFAVQDLSKKKFSYGIQKGETSNQLKLIWSIHLGENDDEVKFAMQGLLIVDRIAESRQVIQKYFDWLIDNKVKLEEENRELKKVNKSVSNQRDLAIRQFDQLIIEKQCLETELYGKFVELLNEKKKKIRELKDELKARPFQRQHSQSIEIQGSDESESEDGLNSTMLQTGDSQSALEQRQLGSHSTATFNMSINHMATPSMDLLATEESAVLEPVIRRRYRPNFPKQSTNVTALKQITEFGSPIQSPIKMLSPPPSTKKRKRSEMESPTNAASKKSSKTSPDAKPSTKASSKTSLSKATADNTSKNSKNDNKNNSPPATTKSKNSKNVSPPNSNKKKSPPTKANSKPNTTTPSKISLNNREATSPTAKKIGQNFIKKKIAASNTIQRSEPIRIALNNENIDTSNISIRSPSLSHNTNTSNFTSADLTNNPITSQLSSSYSDLPLKSPEKKSTAQIFFKQPVAIQTKSSVKEETPRKAKNSVNNYHQPLNLTLEDDASELINMMSY